MCERVAVKLCIMFCVVFYSNSVQAQKVAISTNLLEYVNFGTINGEIGLGFSQHFSIYFQGKYNPFEYKFSSGNRQINNKQLSGAIGAKYWLWHTYSGLFVSGQLSLSKYNRGGITSVKTYEGDAVGITLGAGYALMIKEYLNLDFGLGIMGGYTNFIRYNCPSCGKINKKGKKLFIAPNNVLVQLSYLF